MAVGLVTAVTLLVSALVGAEPVARSTATLTAATPEPTRIVNPVPAAFPPQLDGNVYAIAQVGDTMVVGGAFDTATVPGGVANQRSRIVAFSATTGAIVPGFHPVLNGTVQAIEPGPTPGTVFVGGSFTTLDGTATTRLALLNVTTGSKVASFTGPNIASGTVNDLQVLGSRVLVGGTFKKVNAKPRVGLASLNTSTGVLDSFATLAFTGHHNASGSGAQGPTGISEFAVNGAGTMVAIGNFTDVSGSPRDQVAMIDLTGTAASVRTDWNTSRYQPACYKNAFDSYIRDVKFSPDGSFFSIVATGGPAGGTLCDAATRWESDATGADVQPTWVDNTGGDTLVSVEITDDAVYVGGHQRWLNNTNGSDSPGAGGVPRPGLGALDPLNGVPMTWNPGRNPRGVAVYTMYSGTGGLWTGSNTDWIGNHKYKRPKLAFFPNAGGSVPGEGLTPLLPGNVYLGGSMPGANSNILYRVNTGGGEVGATDNGPNWASDADATSPLRNAGSSPAGWPAGAKPDASVPATTPLAIFDSERWDPNGGDELSWSFPVPTKDHYTVRLYLANRCGCTTGVGARVFNVTLDGKTVLDHYDIVADVGDQVATMKEYTGVTESDGSIDIGFGHISENPLVNGIEIIDTDKAPATDTDAGLRLRQVSGTTFGAETDAPDGKVDWSTVRGAVQIDDTLYYAKADGMLYRRTFGTTGFGVESAVNPYSADPVWNNVKTGSGQTYQSVLPQFYSQLSSLTGLTFRDGVLYYTRTGSTDLFYRAFSPDSGIVSSQEWTVPGTSLTDMGGLFLAGNGLYTVSRATGDLAIRDWNGGHPGTSATVISGPLLDGIDWRARTLFVGP